MSGVEKLRNDLEAALKLSLQKSRDAIQKFQDLLTKGTASQKELRLAKAEADRLSNQHMQNMYGSIGILSRSKEIELNLATKIMLEKSELVSLLDPNDKHMQRLKKEAPDFYIASLKIAEMKLSKTVTEYQALTPKPKDSAAVAEAHSRLTNLIKEEIALVSLKTFNQLVNQNPKKMKPEEKAEHAKALEEARQSAKSALTDFAKTLKSGDPKQKTLHEMVKSFKASEAACEKVLPKAENGSNRQRLSWQKSNQKQLTLKQAQAKRPSSGATFKPW